MTCWLVRVVSVSDVVTIAVLLLYLRFGHDSIFQGFQPVNFQSHVVSWIDMRHAFWSPGENDIACFQRHKFRNISDQIWDAQDQVSGMALLAQLAIDIRA